MKEPPTSSTHPSDPNGSQPDSVDRGLAEAFGEGERKALSTTALQALQARAGSQLGVSLDAQVGEAPVQMTQEAKQLRDPSGRYQVLGEIGRGGVGVVYKGRDSDLGRDVAMKVLKDEYADRPDVLARFVEEAQIGGQLQHPGIVPVYELGLQAGERPYFAMKLVKGETLAAQLARRRGAAEDRRRFLGMFEQVCQTMAYAHARRVMHRDLKPANVMIGAFGEVQIVDWGFAKVLPKGGVADEKESVQRASERSVIETVRSTPGLGSHSRAGSVLGTPAYMSPEQASGDIDHLDCRSDVFGLGAILCEILTGEPPYREADGDLVRQAANAELDGAYKRVEQCGADESLIALCKECLARARRARPEAAGEVAERVSTYLTSVEERARQAELRAAEARYKHRTTLLAAAASMVILALGAGAWIWNENQARTRREETRQTIAAVMSATSGAFGQAQAKENGLDLALWDVALASAENVLSLAQGEDVDAVARADAVALIERVRSARKVAAAERARIERDETMLARLQNLRIPVDDNVKEEDWPVREGRRLDAAYDAAFAFFLGGTSLLETDFEPAVGELRRSDLRVELATSLDHWCLVRDGLNDQKHPLDSAVTDRLREIAAQVDLQDPWRSRVRDLLPECTAERHPLRELSEAADFASLTAAGCRVLSEALLRAGDGKAAVAVLIRAQEIHPGDFDLCFRLALQHELLEPPRWQEALNAYRIAHALRPDHREVLHRQGIVLQGLERCADANLIFDRLISLDPENAHWLSHAGMGLLCLCIGDPDPEGAAEFFFQAMDSFAADAQDLMALARNWRRLGRMPEVYVCLERVVELDPEDVSAHGNVARMYIKLPRSEELLASLDRAIEILADHPESPGSLINLGQLLHARGSYEEALTHNEAAVDLLAEDSSPAGQDWLTHARTSIAFLERIPELEEMLAGSRPVASAEDWDLVATHGYNEGRYREVVQLAESLLEVSPDVVRDGRWEMYYLVCCALHCADDPDASLDEAERSRLRELARQWLGREVARWRTWFAQSGERATDAREMANQAMNELDFVSVRDALRTLPEAEGRAWAELWSSVAEMLEENSR